MIFEQGALENDLKKSRAQHGKIMTKLLFLSIFFYSAVSIAADRPFTFESFLEKRLEQHPDIRAYQKEVEAAQTKASETFWLGDTTLSIARTGAEVPLGGGPNAQTEYGIVQGLNWPGKGYNLTKLAEIEADRVKVDLEKKERQIEKETALLYSQFLSSDLKANIARQKLGTLNSAKKITSRNVRSGFALPIDDNLIEREIELTQLKLEQFTAERTQKVMEIKTQFPDIKTEVPEVQEGSSIPREYFQRKSIHASNLTLRAFSFDVERSLTEANLRQQAIWPDFSLWLTKKNEKDYDVGIGFAIPLWYPIRQSKQVSAAKSLADANEMRLKYLEQAAPLLESTLRLKIEQLKKQIEGRKKIVKSISEVTLKQSKAFFERGRIDWKQLQLAVDAVFEDEEKLVDLDLDLFSAQLDLYELLGVME